MDFWDAYLSIHDFWDGLKLLVVMICVLFNLRSIYLLILSINNLCNDGPDICLEACEFGSIVEGLLPEGLNIYATTSAKVEDSWAKYLSWGTL